MNAAPFFKDTLLSSIEKRMPRKNPRPAPVLDSNAFQFVANTGAGHKKNQKNQLSFLVLDSNAPQFVAKTRKRSSNQPTKILSK